MARAPELGHPALEGDRLAYHVAAAGGTQIVIADLAAGTSATVRSERRAMLLNPSLLDGRLLYVRAIFKRQELRIGPQTKRGPWRDRRLWETVPTGRRDAGHEPGDRHKKHGQPHKLWRRPRRGPLADAVDDRPDRGRGVRDAPAPGVRPPAPDRDPARVAVGTAG